MKTITVLSVVLVTTISLALAGCGQARSWPGEGNLEAAASSERVVLFAPVEVGPLANSYPEAKLAFARDMATRLDLMYDNTESWVGETLPVSSSERWSEAAVGAAAGAHVVVLTEVLDLVEQQPGPGMTPMLEATVRIRGVNALGEEIYRNELTGRVANETSAKSMGGASRPEPKAAWEACKKLISGLGQWVEAQPLPPPGEVFGPKGRTETAPLVDVAVDSTPAGADIFVDGVFRGTTPMVVPMPVRPLTLKLQRQGYQVWEQELTPEPKIQIRPGLEPLPGSAAPAPAPAPEAEAAPAQP